MALLLLSLVSFLFRTLCNKEYSRRYSGLESNIFFNAIGLSVTLIVSIFMGGIALPSPRLLFFASLYGILFVSTVIIILYAYAKGPLGPVQMIYSMSSLIPTLVGLVLFKEDINWMKILGIVIFLSVIILSALDKQAKGQEGKKAYVSPKIWMPVALAAMLTNGSLASIGALASSWNAEESIMVFNFWGYLVGSSILWIWLLICKLRKHDMPQIKAAPGKFAFISILCGVLASSGNISLMYALTTLDSSIAFPLQSVANVALLYLISLFYYKEARSRFGIPMLLLAGCGIVLLSIA